MITCADCLPKHNTPQGVVGVMGSGAHESLVLPEDCAKPMAAEKGETFLVVVGKVSTLQLTSPTLL